MYPIGERERENAYLENQFLASEPIFTNFDWQEMWPESLYWSDPLMTRVFLSIQGYLSQATHTVKDGSP